MMEENIGGRAPWNARIAYFLAAPAQAWLVLVQVLCNVHVAIFVGPSNEPLPTERAEVLRKANIEYMQFLAALDADAHQLAANDDGSRAITPEGIAALDRVAYIARDVLSKLGLPHAARDSNNSQES